MQRAYTAFEYLMYNCTVSDNAAENTAYSALVNASANSEGLAFAYVELCRQLGIDCRIVYGCTKRAKVVVIAHTLELG